MHVVPIKSWRWIWLWKVIFVLNWLILIVPVFVLWVPAKAIVAAFDWYGDKLESFKVRMYNRDLAKWNATRYHTKGSKP